MLSQWNVSKLEHVSIVFTTVNYLTAYSRSGFGALPIGPEIESIIHKYPNESAAVFEILQRCPLKEFRVSTCMTSCISSCGSCAPASFRHLPKTIIRLEISLPYSIGTTSIDNFEEAIASLPNLKYLKLKGGSGRNLHLISDSLEEVDMRSAGKDVYIKSIRCKRLQRLSGRTNYYGSGFVIFDESIDDNEEPQHMSTKGITGEFQYDSISNLLKYRVDAMHHLDSLAAVEVIALPGSCVLHADGTW
jgi:hypothetical protein